MKRKVVLIVEDETDGKIIDKLIQTQSVPCSLQFISAKGIGEIKRRLDWFVSLAKSKIREDETGCVAVLIDYDGDERDRKNLRNDILCQCKKNEVPMITAKCSIESWLLADEGIVKWLGVKTYSNTDSLSNPKSTISQPYYKKTKRKFSKRTARLRLVQNANGIGYEHSPSLMKAIHHLDSSACR